MRPADERRLIAGVLLGAAGTWCLVLLGLAGACLAIRWELRAQYAERSARDAIERIERAGRLFHQPGE